MAELSKNLKEYLIYTSKSVEEAIAHTAQGVVLGRGGNGYGKRREGLYGLTRALAFESRDKVDKLFSAKKFVIKRRYSPPGAPLSGGAYGSGASLLSHSPQAGGKMYRSSNHQNYRRQTKAMFAKGVLISNQGDRRSTNSFSYVPKNSNINYNTTESAKRYKSARFLSVGWLPAVYSWKKAGGQRIKTKSLKTNASKYGSITFEGSGPLFAVTISNNIIGFGKAEERHGILGQALANVAADMADYLKKKFSVKRFKNIAGNPVTS